MSGIGNVSSVSTFKQLVSQPRSVAPSEPRSATPNRIIDVGDLPDGIIDVGDLPDGIIDVGDLPDGIIDIGDLPDGLSGASFNRLA